MLIRDLIIEPVSSYIDGNPNNIILDFEKELLEYLAGDNAKKYQCVITDSCTNAFKSCLFMNEYVYDLGLNYDLPKQTYISMYMALCEGSTNIKLIDNKWSNYYKVGNILDSASYFEKGKLNDMFTNDIAYVLLSFGNQKPLSNNRGGAIIFKKDQIKYNILKRYIHNGRDSAIPVKDDTMLYSKAFGLIGERYNLVPEQVSVLLNKLRNQEIKEVNNSYNNYIDIGEYLAFLDKKI